MIFMKAITLLLALALSAGGALAQQGKGRDGRDSRPRQQDMSHEDRQRMRQDMRDAYRDRDRERGRPERQQRSMSPEERDKLRQDIQDANRQMRR
jgi:hypothetical protein